MMNVIWSLLLTGCVVVDVGSVSSKLCTVEDQEAGSCLGPTDNPYRDAIAAQLASDELAAQGVGTAESIACATHGDRTVCIARFWVAPTWVCDVIVTDDNGETSSEVSCHAA